MADTVDVLKMARELITDPDRWIQGKLSCRNIDGTRCYCAVGAIDEAVAILDNLNDLDESRRAPSLYLRAVTRFRETIGIVDIPAFNDTHTHEEVLEAFDKAIAEAP